jgi:hypothetical protein
LIDAIHWTEDAVAGASEASRRIRLPAPGPQHGTAPELSPRIASPRGRWLDAPAGAKRRPETNIRETVAARSKIRKRYPATIGFASPADVAFNSGG